MIFASNPNGIDGTFGPFPALNSLAANQYS
jgi:hypothetical protein